MTERERLEVKKMMRKEEWKGQTWGMETLLLFKLTLVLEYFPSTSERQPHVVFFSLDALSFVLCMLEVHLLKEPRGVNVMASLFFSKESFLMMIPSLHRLSVHEFWTRGKKKEVWRWCPDLPHEKRQEEYSEIFWCAGRRHPRQSLFPSDSRNLIFQA